MTTAKSPMLFVGVVHDERDGTLSIHLTTSREDAEQSIIDAIIDHYEPDFDHYDLDEHRYDWTEVDVDDLDSMMTADGDLDCNFQPSEVAAFALWDVLPRLAPPVDLVMPDAPSLP